MASFHNGEDERNVNVRSDRQNRPLLQLLGMILAYRYLKVAQSKEQNVGAVRCAVCVAALVAVFIIAARVEGQTDPAEMQSKGAALHAAYCQSCHGDRHHPDIQLRDWILNGKPGVQAMPAFKGQLRDNDVEAILAFVKTWWTSSQRVIQADISIRFEEAFGKKRRKAP